MSAIVSTLVRYLILAFLLVGGLFLVLSVARQDWMREELAIKLADLEKIKDVVRNMNKNVQPAQANIFNWLDSDIIPKDATLDIKAHFGLKRFVLTYTLSKFGKPLQLLIPEMSWTFENDLFLNPSKYSIPGKYEQYFRMVLQDEMKGG